MVNKRKLSKLAWVSVAPYFYDKLEFNLLSVLALQKY
jgi:hypothetical protein